MFQYLNRLPGGFGAWLCPLLAKVELINSVNPGLESRMWRPGEPWVSIATVGLLGFCSLFDFNFGFYDAISSDLSCYILRYLHRYPQNLRTLIR